MLIRKLKDTLQGRLNSNQCFCTSVGWTQEQHQRQQWFCSLFCGGPGRGHLLFARQVIFSSITSLSPDRFALVQLNTIHQNEIEDMASCCGLRATYGQLRFLSKPAELHEISVISVKRESVKKKSLLLDALENNLLVAVRRSNWTVSFSDCPLRGHASFLECYSENSASL